MGNISFIPPVFTSTQKGSVPASGGGTANFLRADGSFVAPVNFSGARVGLAAPLTAKDYTTLTFIPWDTQLYDTDNYWAIGDPTKLVIPAGISKAVFTAGFLTSPSTVVGRNVISQITKNGATSVVSLTPGPSTQLGAIFAVNLSTGLIDVTPGDYFEFRFGMLADTNITVLNESSFFSVIGQA